MEGFSARLRSGRSSPPLFAWHCRPCSRNGCTVRWFRSRSSGRFGEIRAKLRRQRTVTTKWTPSLGGGPFLTSGAFHVQVSNDSPRASRGPAFRLSRISNFHAPFFTQRFDDALLL